MKIKSNYKVAHDLWLVNSVSVILPYRTARERFCWFNREKENKGRSMLWEESEE